MARKKKTPQNDNPRQKAHQYQIKRKLSILFKIR